jgi:hypothetical protein
MKTKYLIVWTTEDDCQGGMDREAKEHALLPTTDERQKKQARGFAFIIIRERLYSLFGVNC